MHTRRMRRTQTGGFADVGGVLWFLLLCLTFPLLDLSTIGLRYTFLLGAARDAATDAAVANTFLTDSSASDLSAVNMAVARTNQNAKSFRGVKLLNVRTNLLITNLTTNAVTRQSTPLSAPADTSQNLYQIEVVVTGDVDPLLTYNNKFFGSVPGLTGPARFVVTSQSVAENPEGMNQ